MLFSDVTFTVHRGDRLAIVGPNGSGALCCARPRRLAFNHTVTAKQLSYSVIGRRSAALVYAVLSSVAGGHPAVSMQRHRPLLLNRQLSCCPGKTSLLRLLAGKDAPDAGTVRLRRGTRIGVPET